MAILKNIIDLKAVGGNNKIAKTAESRRIVLYRNIRSDLPERASSLLGMASSSIRVVAIVIVVGRVGVPKCRGWWGKEVA